MARSLLRQYTQVSGTHTYVDTLSLGQGAESAPDLQTDLNYIRSQLKNITGKSSWYDIPDTNLASVDFINLADVEIGSYTANNMLYTTATGVDDTSDMTYDPSTGDIQLGAAGGARVEVDASASSTVYGDDDTYLMVSGTGQSFVEGGTLEFSVTSDGVMFNKGARVDEILDSNDDLDSSSTDDQLATAKLIYNELATLSGAITSSDTFLGLEDTISSYTANNMLYTTATGVQDTSDMTYDPSTGNIQLGDSSDTYLTISESADRISAYANTVEGMRLLTTVQYFGDPSDTCVYVDQDMDGVEIDISTTPTFRVTSAGMWLKNSTATVDEILNVNESDAINSSSTDKQLATAKLIYNTFGATAISGTPTYMYYVGSDGNMAETANMTFTSATNNIVFNDGSNPIFNIENGAGTAEWWLGDKNSNSAYIWQDISSSLAKLEIKDGSDTTRVSVADDGTLGLGRTSEAYIALNTTSKNMHFYADDVKQMTVASGGLNLRESTVYVNEILNTADGDDINASSTDDQLATAKLIYNELAAISGTVNSMTFLDLTDTINSYTANNMLYTTAGGVQDTSRMTYDPSSGLIVFKSSGGTGFTSFNTSSYDIILGRSGHARMFLDDSADKIQFFSSEASAQLEIDDNGIKLQNSTATVDEILNVADGDAINSSSTDDQLATAKLIYDTFGGTAVSGTPNNMYYVGSDGKIADTSDMTYDPSTGNIQLGDSSDTYFSLNQSNNSIHGYAGNNQVFMLLPGQQVLGRSANTRLTVDYDDGAISAYVGTNLELTISNGIHVKNSNAWINEFLNTSDGDSIDSSSTDAQLATAKLIYNYVDTISGSMVHNELEGLQGGTANEYYHLTANEEGQISASAHNVLHLGYQDTYVNILGTGNASPGYVFNYEDDPIVILYGDRQVFGLGGSGDYNMYIDTDGEILFRTGSSINEVKLVSIDTSGMDIRNDLTVSGSGAFGGNLTVDGTFGFDSGTTVNEIVTSIDEPGSDDRLVTEQGIVEYIDTISGTLETDNIWEIVDTPYTQIRPKPAHITKPVYLGDNLTIAGDLTVSGTTTTINSEELTVADKVITVNYGEVGSGITGDPYAGIDVDRGSEADYLFVFDEAADNFRVGVSGTQASFNSRPLQAVATREDSPIDTRVAWWDASNYTFRTQGDTYITVVSGAGAGSINNYVDSTNVLSLSDSLKTFGEWGQNAIRLTGTTTQTFVAGGSGVMALSATTQYIGNTGDTNVTLDQTADTITFEAAHTTEVTIGTGGLALASGPDVNEILDSNDDLNASSTDDQLATAKLIYNEISSISGTVSSMTYLDLTDTPSAYSNDSWARSTASGVVWDTIDHNDDLSTLQGGNGSDEYYHLTANEDSAFSSDGATFTFTQALVGTSADLSGALDVGGNADFEGNVSVSGTFGFGGQAVNEIVTTVTDTSTDNQLPTAGAVWDLMDTYNPHTHYDKDCTFSGSNVWTLTDSSVASMESSSLKVYLNGLKNKNDSDYYTSSVSGNKLTITFAYNTYASDWCNVEYLVINA